MNQARVKCEVQQLRSQYLDGTLMYPKPMALWWIKQPHFPWILAGIREAGDDPAT